ncbi:MAG: GTP 3',8-cyclase MoaA [Nocardioides sp.]|nr:GTP 3',8-cyclase MoaA [Nocardioides sp.]
MSPSQAGLPAPHPEERSAPTAAGALVDTHGRVATDLRVSLTDRCNLRCSYCMPAEGLDWLPGEEVLTDDEVVRLIRIGVEDLGIREVRFTGGEPLLRRGLPGIVAATKALRPSPEVSLTTNALGLERTADALAAAGLDRVNVSLDTARPDTFATITRRGRFEDVVAGMAAAQEAGLRPVKVNAVLLRGVNDDQAAELLAWCLERDYALRFIEQMPLDAQHDWHRGEMVTAEEILAQLESAYTLTPAVEPRGSAPAELFVVDGGPATVGVIGSVTRPFCGDCDRVRLTADGQVRNCLFAREESDLRASLRGGASDAEIAERWRAAMWVKRPGHGIDDPTFLQPARPMSAIGG